MYKRQAILYDIHLLVHTHLLSCISRSAASWTRLSACSHKRRSCSWSLCRYSPSKLQTAAAAAAVGRLSLCGGDDTAVAGGSVWDSVEFFTSELWTFTRHVTTRTATSESEHLSRMSSRHEGSYRKHWRLLPLARPVWARGRCRISPPRFLAECCKRQLNQASYVFCCILGCFLFLICTEFVYLFFSRTVLFVSISEVIGCEDRLRNDLYCVEWGVKLYSIHPSIELNILAPHLHAVYEQDGNFSTYMYTRWHRKNCAKYTLHK